MDGLLTYESIKLSTRTSPNEGLLEEVLQGLRKPQKSLPPKLFYDERGSWLFDQICQQGEYYLTRTEIAIMESNIGEIADLLGSRCMLVEFGSGSGIKTRLLLNHLKHPAAYIPIDICRECLVQTATDLSWAYPDIKVLPVWADYTAPFSLPHFDGQVSTRVAYFPGSTIGNLYPDEAVNFLKSVARIVGEGGGLLVGVDLKKATRLINLAYNDRAGVTADFNLNVLAHLNREMNANFRLDLFRHFAFYNPREGRVEMHLVSQMDQVVLVDGKQVRFRAGESILTEVSYKYSLDEFAGLAGEAGFRVLKVWTDIEGLFSVQFLTYHGDLTKTEHTG